MTKIRETPLMIAVQGHIDYSRREYELLIALCKKLSEKDPQNNKETIVFNIIGSIKRSKEANRFINVVKHNNI